MDDGAGKGRAGAGQPYKRRGRAVRVMVRWSIEREERFLDSLVTTPNVAQALRVSGLSDRSVRRRRETSADFRAKWHAALCEGYANDAAINIGGARGEALLKQPGLRATPGCGG